MSKCGEGNPRRRARTARRRMKVVKGETTRGGGHLAPDRVWERWDWYECWWYSASTKDLNLAWEWRLLKRERRRGEKLGKRTRHCGSGEARMGRAWSLRKEPCRARWEDYLYVLLVHRCRPSAVVRCELVVCLHIHHSRSTHVHRPRARRKASIDTAGPLHTEHLDPRTHHVISNLVNKCERGSF